MNPEIDRLYGEYRNRFDNDVVAALLVLADVLSKSEPPDPIIVEPEDCTSYTVREVARRLNLTSKQIYQMILAGVLHCFHVGPIIRIPIDEIENYEADVQPSTALACPP